MEIEKLINKRFFVYGAGELATSFLDALSWHDSGLHPQGIIVSDARNNPKEINGVKIIPFDEIKDSISNDDIVIVAMAKNCHKDVEAKLVDAGIENYIFFGTEEKRSLIRKSKPLDTESLLKSGEPIDREFGFNRGTPIDRYYIEKFLEKETWDIKSADFLLEVGDDNYIKKYFPDAKGCYDILDYVKGMDLTKPETLPCEKYDVFICTQTFNFIYDVKAAIQGAMYVLKPGGILLATVGGNITQVSQFDMDKYGHFWGFTYLGIERLVKEVFGKENVRVNTFGNSSTATAFINGIAMEEFPRADIIDKVDAGYAVVIGVAAMKK